MKKLLIILSVIALTTSFCYSQAAIDSVSIHHPETKELLDMVKPPAILQRKLDKLGREYKKNTFVLLFYFSDGLRVSVVVEKRLNKKEILERETFLF